uniref:Putative secreted protein n=1 Tax=Anopheles marajoara TaxID=58244 RepID=A0A2M4C897_9DIPT
MIVSLLLLFADFLYTNSYGGDNIIDIDEYIDPSIFMHGNHILNNNNNDSSPYPAIPWECSQVQIEELPSDFNDPSLQPEVDQQTSLMSESATLLLSKPTSSYSIEM